MAPTVSYASLALKNLRSRTWFWTLNNYTDEQLEDLKSRVLGNSSLTYMLFGREVAPTTGTRHLQGLTCFKNAKVGTAFAAWMNCEGLYISGKVEQMVAAIAYCKKEGNFHERGVPPMTQAEKGEAGKQAWEGYVAHAKVGNFEAIEPKVLVAHFNSFVAIKHHFQSKRHLPNLDQMDFLWFHGPPGTGKSHTALTKYPEAYVKANTKWWQGYELEEVVIWQEVHPKSASEDRNLLEELKLLCDLTPLTVEVKNAHARIRPKCVIVTSNYSIQEMWPMEREHAPLLRRFRQYLFDVVAPTVNDIVAPPIDWRFAGTGGPPAELLFKKRRQMTIVELDEAGNRVAPAAAPQAAPAQPADLNFLDFNFNHPAGVHEEEAIQVDAHHGNNDIPPSVLHEEENEEEEAERLWNGPAPLTRQNNIGRLNQGPGSSAATFRLPEHSSATSAPTARRRNSSQQRSMTQRTEQLSQFPYGDDQADEVASAAAALLDLDGDSEPSQGEDLGSQDSPHDENHSQYLGTDEEDSSQNTTRFYQPDVEEESDEESIF